MILAVNTFSVGVDVGGTFTDVVLFDHAERRAIVAKVPSDPSNQSIAFMNALTKVGTKLNDVQRVLHGTTVATNAILEGKGSRVALLTTEGFRDIIEIGRGERSKLYDLKLIKLPPLVPRPARFEVPERTQADGTIGRAIDADGVRAALKAVDPTSFDAWAVCFLHAYANPANEQAAGALLAELAGDTPISISSAVTPEYREYERFSTTVLNAAVAPVMNRYLGAVEDRLDDGGYRHPLLVMHSSGGVMTARAARQLPAATILSGPAGGVAGARAIARDAGIGNIITCDMGGTSTDVALIKDGEIRHTTEGRIAGYPTRIPQVDIVTVGAGGGSIASVTGDTLRVGPESAGARPGPACYGHGGVEPTVTDANLLLNRLNSDDQLSGEIALHPDRAETAVDRLKDVFPDLDTIDLAEGIVHLATVKMAGTIREVSVYRGHDPRDFVLLAYGGAGPMFASELASELGMASVLIPPHPGNLSALGLLVSPLKRDFVRTLVRRLDAMDSSELADAYRDLQTDCEREFEADQLPSQDLEYERSVDVRYIGQSSTLNLKCETDHPDPVALSAEFHSAHEIAFSHAAADEPVELVNVRVSAILPVDPLDISAEAPTDGSASPSGTRPVTFRSKLVDCPVYARDALPVGTELDGPLIVEETGSTSIVWPSDKLRVDEWGNLRVEVGEK
ncbi:MAG: 5-oxoprolinase [Alphaproteobacteria bacterium]|nr:5-oxoprolinase [Alphaproteobacteria bacterium]